MLATGWYAVGLTPGQMQTLTFVMLVFAGQANVFVMRERRYFWRSWPAPVMILASSADVAVVATLAARGVLMNSLPLALIAALLAATVVFAFALDLVKIATLSQLRID